MLRLPESEQTIYIVHWDSRWYSLQVSFFKTKLLGDQQSVGEALHWDRIENYERWKAESHYDHL